MSIKTCNSRPEASTARLYAYTTSLFLRLSSLNPNISLADLLEDKKIYFTVITALLLTLPDISSAYTSTLEPFVKRALITQA